jgi:putative cell wall-binding protein
VQRAEGPDRYATAAKLSEGAFAPDVPVAYVATGLNFPDALAAGAAGAHFGGPVLLTKGDTLQPATATELARLKPKRIVVVGGPDVVSSTTEAQLRSLAPEVVRLAGADRWETSRAVARDMRGTREAQMVSLATGGDFPDALSAGPAVAALGGSLVLVGTTLAPGMAEEVLRNEPALIVAVGGPSVVSASVLDRARAMFDDTNGLTATQAAPSNGVAPRSTPVPADSQGGLEEGRENYDPHQKPWQQQRHGG